MTFIKRLGVDGGVGAEGSEQDCEQGADTQLYCITEIWFFVYLPHRTRRSQAPPPLRLTLSTC
jgi:hypothetical protein